MIAKGALLLQNITLADHFCLSRAQNITPAVLADPRNSLHRPCVQRLPNCCVPVAVSQAGFGSSTVPHAQFQFWSPLGTLSDLNHSSRVKRATTVEAQRILARIELCLRHWC